MDEVTAVYLVPIAGALTVLIDFGRGPGVLGDDGKIWWVGECWLTERSTPRRMGRYTQLVNPWTPSHVSAKGDSK